ncbi:MotA/TolQ/ExbB proton channel family protein [Verrucomicrobium spinosum]|uniref:MotA/TolQ/ExbB proton channel family protein n=1 Tax=Verrucomicrobium spinosum TaxID=2736 RepID=UPI0001745139|nr:MotA/TolQ/ExbB proton channel family protein [Verrucomicrobium spinosum]
MKSYSILLAVFLVAGTSVFAAEAPKSPDAKSEAPVVHNKTLWEQIKEGGWVMVPIGVCSVLTLYLMGDGFLRVTNPKKLLPSEEIEAVKSLYRQGKYNDAYQFCKSRASAFANVTRVATSQLGEGKSATEEGVIAEIMKENSRMQTFISYLSVIGVCTPMIGLVGTVTGMMGAFATLGTSGIGDPSQLSAHIGEVLVATASGLFVAIPAFTAYYWLRNRAARVLHDLQDTVSQLMRKMPYDKLAGAHIGDEEIVAADPEWWVESEPVEA